MDTHGVSLGATGGACIISAGHADTFTCARHSANGKQAAILKQNNLNFMSLLHNVKGLREVAAALVSNLDPNGSRQNPFLRFPLVKNFDTIFCM